MHLCDKSDGGERNFNIKTKNSHPLRRLGCTAIKTLSVPVAMLGPVVDRSSAVDGMAEGAIRNMVVGRAQHGRAVQRNIVICRD